MDIDKLTLGEIKQIAKVVGCGSPSQSHSIPTGEAVFIRTVTHYYTGHVERVTDSDVVLSSAAWISDTGRFADALRLGEMSEVEPYPPDALVSVSRGAILDVSAWAHDLPREQK